MQITRLRKCYLLSINYTKTIITVSAKTFQANEQLFKLSTHKLRLKPRLLLTIMEVTTAVDTDTPTTDTDTVWAVTTDMESIPVWPPTPVPPPHLLPDLPKVLASKCGVCHHPRRNLRAMLRYMLYTFRNASNNVPK